MKFDTHRTNSRKVDTATDGTCLRIQSVPATYERLVALFGEPDRYDSDDDDCDCGGEKVKAHWGILFEDGEVATIYDWKEYGRKPEQVTHWNIGGHRMTGPNRVFDMILNRS